MIGKIHFERRTAQIHTKPVFFVEIVRLFSLVQHNFRLRYMSLVFLFNRCFSPVSRTICSLPTMSRWFSRCVYLQLFSLHSVRFLLLCHLFFCIFARNNLIAVSIQCENIGTVFRSYFIYAVLFFAFRFSFISRKKKENRMLFF